MTSLLGELSHIVEDAFIAEGLSGDMGGVRISDRPDLAQFQCNGAMIAAKQAKKNPRAVAEVVVARLKNNPVFSKIEIAGPGFINLNIADQYLTAHLEAAAKDVRCGVPLAADGETIVLDYGGPNIAKAMHVGHLRTAIIGEALRRIFLFSGYNAISDVHMGDWGTQIGMVISEFRIRHPEWPYFNAASSGPYPAESPFTLADLEEVYPFAAQACKDDDARKEMARVATAELQDGRPGYRALWKHIVNVSVAGMKENYDALNVHFDLWNGESSVHDLIEPMVGRLEEKGYAVKDGGATVIPVAKNDDQKEYPPLILYKSDGAVMYGTTDLATLVDRMKMNPRKVIYVVDQRQGLHFEQVFRAAYKTGIVPPDVGLIHAGNGTMNGTDGKPFKTRAGGVLRLEDLVGSARSKALDLMMEANLAQDADQRELEDTAHMVGIAAIKFADLQNQRQSDYIFDLDRMTSFEGKTGPYMLYQAVRIKSLLRKAKAQGDMPGQDIILKDEDRPLALLCLELPETIEATLRNYTPHVLCDYAYRLANAFSSFYGNCHILSEPDPLLKKSRLALSALVLAELELALDLLGIRIPDRM
ncbi:MAG TPA: arginine--tRNA ligase [Micavibrio sp.]|jgi:arginyl-tRNA synthetase